MNPTPEKLLADATAVWEARNSPRQDLPAHETLIGELPAGAGQVLVVTRKARGRRMPSIRFRYWSVAPDGHRVPLTFGMNISAELLPSFAGLVSRALRIELDELAAATPETRHPATAAALREAFYDMPRGSTYADPLPAWATGETEKT
jgi:hypothetical protein